jgi:Dihydroprymidine dehydrogenase domain II, 4Fe-4S cluster
MRVDSPRDITPLPDLAHGRSRGGPVRAERPVYVDLLPPCNAACPAGENIQEWLARVQAGEHERAWRVLVADNPFAAIHGRVCYHPCETSCNRAQLDSAVSIHAVERFLGDLARERAWSFESPAVRTGRRVLVIGGGRGRTRGGGIRCGVRRCRRTPVEARGDTRDGCGADGGCGVVPAWSRVGGTADDRAPGCGLRRREHGDGRGADGASAGRRGGVDRLPPHARADAGARGRGPRRRAGGGADQLAANDHGVRG